MFPEPVYILGIPFHLFGVFAALGIFAAYLMTAKDLRRQGIVPDFLPDLAFATLGSAFLAARMFYILIHWQQYLKDPLGLFRIWEGGLVLHAGILGGLAGGFMFCRKKHLDFAKLADSVALGLALGFAIGRLGCFFAGCCFGKPTLMPWGVTFNHPLAVARPLGESLHPAQLYFFLAEMVIFTGLLYKRTRKTFNGQILLLYLCLASAARLLLNPFRGDSQTALFVLPFLIFIFSLLQYFNLKTKQGRIYEIKIAV